MKDIVESKMRIKLRMRMGMIILIFMEDHHNDNDNIKWIAQPKPIKAAGRDVKKTNQWLEFTGLKRNQKVLPLQYKIKASPLVFKATTDIIKDEAYLHLIRTFFIRWIYRPPSLVHCLELAKTECIQEESMAATSSFIVQRIRNKWSRQLVYNH